LGAPTLGGGKAKAVAALLNELNSSVAGSFVDEAPEDIIANDPAGLYKLNAVVTIACKRLVSALVPTS
jgi:hypothetical protein